MDALTPITSKPGTTPADQRASRYLGSASREALRAKARMDAAAKALEAAKADFETASAVNAAQLHFAITCQLVEAMRGVFAMGAAWTLMRAVSGYRVERRGRRRDHDSARSVGAHRRHNRLTEQERINRTLLQNVPVVRTRAIDRADRLRYDSVGR